ncbi:MAG: nucleoside/nucleotide kinase family protein [Cereibacter sphaeroides]|uniref:Nucleoside/nucleotide kinase family protein n=1 Tax=Cereibacter sphaeroides TaxID=1063 RepID=A0A2W5TYM7_CERSP|nr:MAG: nucleoside/nucleotide kinase family protein [Cereibacter sphaeroides]
MDDLAARIAARADAAPGRFLVGIAGAPGAGKSTIAEELVTRLGPRAALVPMDGFHLDNAILDARGRRFHKGSPDTFDVGGLVSVLQRLKAGGEVIVPVFDRYRDVSVGSARIVPVDAKIIISEGNYLLLQDEPWTALAPLWDMRVFLDVPEADLERRLIARWEHHGLSAEEGRRRAFDNDIPNARTVIARSAKADVVLSQNN